MTTSATPARDVLEFMRLSNNAPPPTPSASVADRKRELAERRAREDAEMAAEEERERQLQLQAQQAPAVSIEAQFFMLLAGMLSQAGRTDERDMVYTILDTALRTYADSLVPASLQSLVKLEPSAPRAGLSPSVSKFFPFS